MLPLNKTLKPVYLNFLPVVLTWGLLRNQILRSSTRISEEKQSEDKLQNRLFMRTIWTIPIQTAVQDLQQKRCVHRGKEALRERGGGKRVAEFTLHVSARRSKEGKRDTVE